MTTPTPPTPPAIVYAGDGAWRVPTAYHRGMVLPAAANDRARCELAMKGLKSALRERELLVPLKPGQKEDPGFGPLVEQSIMRLQRQWGLSPTGKITRKEAFCLFLPDMHYWQMTLPIPGFLVIGLIGLESGYDPGAEGRKDPRDRGLGQVSEKWRKWVTDEMAYGDPMWAIQYVAGELERAFKSRWAMTEELDLSDDDRYNLAWDCAVAAHNGPEKSKEWARTGAPPDKQIDDYVKFVRRTAARPI